MVSSSNVSLLVALVKGDWPAADARVSDSLFDVASFQHFAAHHQLSGYLHTRLADAPVRDRFPEAFLESLHTHHRKLLRRNPRLLNVLKELTEQFRAAGLDAIVLKGLYLADRFYHRLDRRTFWDLDLLVRTDQLADAQHGLRAIDYVRKSPILINERLSSRFTHAFDYERNGSTLDLHWALSNHPSYLFDYAAIWRDRKPYAVEDVAFDALSDDYTLLFNLTGILADIERGGLRFRSLVDLYMILQGVAHAMDWPAFFEKRRAERAYRACGATLALFLDLFDGHGEFPALSQAVGAMDRWIPDTPAKTLALLSPSWMSIAQKRWAAPLYESSGIHFFRWWLVSLPFRVVVYRPGKWSRFKRNVQRWMQRRGWRP